MTDDKEFEHALEHVLNYYSRDNMCNTADFILAAYLNDQIKAFARAKKRDEIQRTPSTVEDRPLFH